jgi:hypothetical protein
MVGEIWKTSGKFWPIYIVGILKLSLIAASCFPLAKAAPLVHY